MHPSAFRQLLNAEINCALINTRTPHNRYTLPVHEEIRVLRIREADVVCRQTPAHLRRSQNVFQLQRTCHIKKQLQNAKEIKLKQLKNYETIKRNKIY